METLLLPGTNNVRGIFVQQYARIAKRFTLLLCACAIFGGIAKAQAPSVDYGTGIKTFSQNSAIAPLTPTASNVAAFGFAAQAGWSAAGSVPYQVTGFSKNAQGDVFMLDGGTLQITKFPANGGTPVNVAPDDYFYTFILDNAGNIYGSNPLTLAITRIDAVTGAKITLGAGDFELPYAIALGKDGTVYATDYITHKLKKIAPGTTNAVEVTTPIFELPLGLAADAAGNLYVTDGHGLTITKIWLATDGHASQIPTGIRQPYAITIDKADNLFVGDYSNNRIVEIPADGSGERTVASNISAINGLDIDAKGNLYSSCQDRTAGVIIPPTGGYFIDTYLPAGLSFDSNTGTISGTPTILTTAKTYTVTAYNGTQSSTADFTIKIASTNADLSALTSSGATLSPAFNTATISYSASVGASTSSINITPTVADAEATITYNGTSYASGSPISISLSPGANSIPLIVTSAAGNTKTYTVSIIKFATPSISYAAGIKTFSQNSAIAPLTPTASNVAAFGFAAQAGWSAAGSVAYQVTGFSKNAQGDVFMLDGGTLQITKFPANGGTPVNVAPDDYFYTFILDNAGNIYGSNPLTLAITRIDAVTGAKITLGAGDFELPYAIALGKDGTVYATDYITHKLKKIAPGTTNAVEVTTPIFELPLGLAADAAGNLYVTDGHGLTITKIWLATDGHASQIPTGIRQPYAITIDKADNLFVGDYSNNRIVEIPADGSGERTVASNISAINGLDIDAKGNLYASCQDRTAGVIIPPTGGYFIDANLPAGLTFNSNTGEISGTPTQTSPATTYKVTAYNGIESNSANVTIQVTPPVAKIAYNTPNTYTGGTAITQLVPTAANIAAPAYSSTSTTIVSGGFNNLSGAVADTAGNLYVADRTNNRVKKVTPNGTVTEIGGTFASPYDIGIDGKGNLYVAENGASRVRKIPFNGGPTMTIDSGLSVYNLSVDVSGNVYYSSYQASSPIYKIPANGGPRVVAAPANGATGYALAVDNAGNLYTGTISGNLYKYPAGGGARETVLTGINVLVSIKTDAEGNIYMIHAVNVPFAYVIEKYSVADGSRTMIRNIPNEESFRFGLDGKGNLYTLQNYPGQAIIKTEPTGGFHAGLLPAGLLLNNTTGVISGTPTAASNATDYKIYAYGASTTDSAKVNITVKAPVPVIAYNSPNTYAVGTAISALAPSVTNGVAAPAYSSTSTTVVNGGFNYLSGAAADTAGNLYVADRQNNRVKKVTPNGTVTEIGGTFASPYDIGIDGKGNLYVAEMGASRVRKIPYNGGPTMTIDSGQSVYNLAVDVTGNVYYNSYFSSSPIYKIPANGGPRVVAAPANGATGYALAIDNAGNLYTGTIGGNLYKYPAGGGARETVLTGINVLVSIKTDAEGNIYMIHANNVPFAYVIEKYSVADGSRTMIRNIPNEESFRFGLDGKGNLYTLQNYPGQAIIKTEPTGGFHAGLLPAGLLLNNTTGVISGTPTAGSRATDYKITAYNSWGVGSTMVNMAVPTADANLAALTPSAGTLSPAFDAYTLDYTINVAGETAGITLKPAVADLSASVKVNGVDVASGQASAANPLDFGNNLIPVVVLASDNSTTKTYNVTVNRAPSAALANIILSDGALDKAFNKDSLTYKVTLPAGTSTVQITPTSLDPAAVITAQDGSVTILSSTPATFPLHTFNNAYVMVIVASNGAMKTYTINVYVQPSANADLTNLVGTQGLTLTPVFDPAKHTYSANVGFDKMYFTVMATAAVQSTYIKYNNVFTRLSGQESGEIDLNVGLNTIPITTTAEDGTTTNSYTLLITREGAANAYLTGIDIANATFNETFDEGLTNYTAAIGHSSLQTSFTPLLADANATVKVNGVAVTDPAYSDIYNLVVGDNVFTVEVTSQNGVVTKNYTVTLIRAKSSDARLSRLTANVGTYYPFEDAAEFHITVANNVNNIKLTPTLQDTTATMTVSGLTSASGIETAPITLNVGSNTIPIVITAQDGLTTRTVNVIITRAADASLTSLTVSAGTLSPAFDKNTYSYTATVANGVSTITLMPTAAGANASIKVNGAASASGAASAPVALLAGVNTIHVEVTATDGGVKTYTLAVTRIVSSNAYLSDMRLNPLSALTRLPGAGNNFTATVASSVTTVALMPTAAGYGAQIKVNNVAVASGTYSGAITLNASGPTVISMEVTAEDGIARQIYSITVTRTGSSNAYLSEIRLDPPTVLTRVAGAGNNFTATVASSVTTVSLMPIAADAGAQIKLNNTVIASGTYSGAITLNASGPTVIGMEVTAENGVDKQIYSITVTRTGSSNAYLSEIRLNPSTVLTRVAGTGNNFTATVASSVTTVSVMPTAADAGAHIKVNNVAVTSGTYSGAITLNASGPTVIGIEVTAENGVSTQIYSITVTRAGSSNAYLSDIRMNPLSALTRTPGGGNNFTATVASSATTVTVMPTAADAGAHIKVNNIAVTSGTYSGAITLNASGPTVIGMEVTAENGVSTQIYSITVTRSGSSNAYLSDIRLDPSTAVVRVPGAGNNFTATVSSSATTVSVMPTAADAGAHIKVNNIAVASGTYSGTITLNASGPTIFGMVVTAENGISTQTYSITVNRAAPPVIAAVNKNRNTIEVLQKPEPSTDPQAIDLVVKQAVSPNGDGINDRLTIQGINAFPENTVRIMNRNGDVVYEARGYDNESKAFDGHSSKGTLQQAGTYFYSVEYKKGTETKRKTGYMVLKY
jgi:gliding motility-associated-like protein